MKPEWSRISLIFLFLVAFIGTLIRSMGFISIPFEYVNLVHAHSHTAFQGWVYLIMLLLLTKTFLSEDQIKAKRYPLQFKLTVFIVIGILVSFSLQGYALYSIIFSTLFQLLNYWFVFSFLKALKQIDPIIQKSISIRFIKAGLWFGVLSTLLPFGIGILAAKGLGGTEAYQSLVYSFLHLQYNGWFLFVVLGLLFNYLDRKNILYNKKFGIRCYWLLSRAVIPAISLSLLGMTFSNYIIVLAYISVLLIGGALVYFLKALPSNLFTVLKNENKLFKSYFITFLVSFILKMILQCFSILPFFKTYAFSNKSIIIAYLHLSLIGAISFLLLALLIEKKWLPTNNFVKTGSTLLIIGFVTTELLLLFSGLGIIYNHIALIIGSAAMAIGILMLIINKTHSKAF